VVSALREIVNDGFIHPEEKVKVKASCKCVYTWDVATASKIT